MEMEMTIKVQAQGLSLDIHILEEETLVSVDMQWRIASKELSESLLYLSFDYRDGN